MYFRLFWSANLLPVLAQVGAEELELALALDPRALTPEVGYLYEFTYVPVRVEGPGGTFYWNDPEDPGAPIRLSIADWLRAGGLYLQAPRNPRALLTLLQAGECKSVRDKLKLRPERKLSFDAEQCLASSYSGTTTVPGAFWRPGGV